jgi:predicted MPP superfamily phosphohydrolase
MLKNTKGINKAVEIINSENPDLIVLTGDLVNNTANEVDGFENTFLKLKAKDGKLSILGNHDYGDYFPWKNTSDKNNNLIQLKNKHSQIGFKLLLNSNISIQKNVDSIIIAGVENWGKPPFSQFGNLTKALQNTSSNNFVILLSHDPSHWKEKITDKTNIELTLSGHTHAMQAGIKFGNFQWSPVSLKYKEWGGLYKHKKQYLYVNKGLGFIGLLGRIGIRPEITKIILRKTK